MSASKMKWAALFFVLLTTAHDAARAALEHELIFVRRAFRGASGKAFEAPFETRLDSVGDLYKRKVDGTVVRLTRVAELQGGARHPAVSWDGARVLFTMRRHPSEGWHIFEMSVDGTGLRQVTFDAPGRKVNDIAPCYLSNGESFVFISDRDGGIDEHGRGTAGRLYIGRLDSGAVRRLGHNPSGEAAPALDNGGALLFSRWDAMRGNRRGVLWRAEQDGGNAAARWGQYGTPAGSPVAGYAARQFPGDGDAPHVGLFTGWDVAYGRLGLFTPTAYQRDPERNPALFPQNGRYAAPAPIDAQRLLYAYSPDEQGNDGDFGIYLDSRAGDARVLIYNATNTHELDPALVMARTPPPITGGRVAFDTATGLFVCDDVTLRGDCRQPCALSPGLGDPALPWHFAPGTARAVRVFQPLPRRGAGLDVTLGGPALSMDGVQTGVLGEVVVAGDGSAAMRVAPGAPFSFQLIDEYGAAIVHERNWLATQPGETQRCLGCHTPRNNVSFPVRHPGAEPQALFAPRDLSSAPRRAHTYTRDIQPLFTRRCLPCHAPSSAAGGLDLSRGRSSYASLLAGVTGRVPARYAAQRSARNSFLFQLMTGDAYGQTDHQARIDAIQTRADHRNLLTADERRLLAEWLDTETAFAFAPDGLAAGPPALVESMPPAGAQQVPLNAALELRFNEPIDPGSLLPHTLTVREGAHAVGGALTFPAEHVARFAPGAAWKPNAAYTVALATDVADLEGNTLAAALTFTFRTGSASDTTAPALTEVTSGDAAAAVALSGPLLVRFSEPLAAGSLTRDAVRLLDARGRERDFYVVPGDERRELVVVPLPPLDPDAPFTLEAIGPFVDAALLPVAATRSLAFRTAAVAPPSALTLIADSYDRAPWQFDPQDIALTPDGAQMTAVDFQESKLYWFDAQTRAVAHTAGTGRRPISLALNAAGDRLFLLCREAKTVEEWDVNARRKLGEATIPSSGTDLALSGDGRRVVVADVNPDRVYVIDVAPTSPDRYNVIAQATTGDNTGLRAWAAVTRDGGKIYVAGNMGLDVFELRGATLTRVKRLFDRQQLSEAALTPDERQLLVINRTEGVVAVLDTAADRQVAEIAVDFTPEESWQRREDRLALSPDGKTAFVVQKSVGRVWALDRLTQLARASIDLRHEVTALAIANDGGELRAHLFTRNYYQERTRWLTLRGPVAIDGGAPRLVQTDPADDETDIAVNRTITLSFSEPMDRNALSPQTALVDCLACTEPARKARVAVDEDNLRAHIIPDATWPADALLRVRLLGGARDLTGRPLGATREWTFRTARTQPAPHLSFIADHPPAGTDANDMELTPDGRYVLVSDGDSRQLIVFDQQSLNEIARVRVGREPDAMVCSPDGARVYVCNRDDATVSVVDLDRLRELRAIAVDATPVAIARDEWKLYVACSSTTAGIHRVLELDAASEAVVARHDFAAPIEAIDVDARGIVYAATTRIHTIRDGRVSTHAPPAVSGGLMHRLRVSRDGYQLFIGDGWRNHLGVFDPISRAGVDMLPTAQTVNDVRITPDQRYVISVHWNDESARVFDRKTSALLATFPLGRQLTALGIAPDGRRIFGLRRAWPGNLVVWGIGDAADHTPPAIMGVDPPDGARNVSANCVLRVRFSEQLDRSTIAATSVTLYDAQGTPVGAAVSLSRDNRAAYLAPSEPLAVAATYRARVTTEAKDLAGNSLPATLEWTFHTAPLHDPVVSALASAANTNNGYHIAAMTTGAPVVVSNYWSNSLTLHHPDTLAKSFTLDWGLRTGRAMPVDGERCWVSYPEQKQLSLVDIAAGRVLLSDHYAYNHVGERMSWNREHLMVVAGSDPAYLLHYRLAGLTIAASRELRIANWPRAVVPAPDGGYAYLVYGNGISFLNLDTLNTERWVSGDDWGDAQITSDGRLLYAVEKKPGRLVVIDTATGARLTALPVGGRPTRVAISADGALAGVTNYDDGTIYLYDGFTNRRVAELTPGARLETLAFSPDGSRLYAASSAGSTGGLYAYAISQRRTIAPTATATATASATPTNAASNTPTTTATATASATPTDTYAAQFSPATTAAESAKPTPSRPASPDLNDDRRIDRGDLLALIGVWPRRHQGESMLADVDGSGRLTHMDLLTLARRWQTGVRDEADTPTAAPSDTFTPLPTAAPSATPSPTIAVAFTPSPTPTTAAGGGVSFRNDVLPILQRHLCTGCHLPVAGLDVSSVDGLLRGGVHGPAVLPGDPDKSILYDKVAHSAPAFGQRMPPYGQDPLSATEIALLRRWIAEGAANN